MKENILKMPKMRHTKVRMMYTMRPKRLTKERSEQKTSLSPFLKLSQSTKPIIDTE